MGKTVRFSEYEWTLRGAGIGDPGPNEWDDGHAWVDDAGALHLRVAPREGAWYCAEVASVERFGFGRYQFWLEGPVARMDMNVVLGLFTYPTPDVGKSGTHELDIEFAKWGHRSAHPGNYTVWPADPKLRNTHRIFAPDFRGELSTHRFTWSAKSVFFQSLCGHRDDDEQAVASWHYEPEDAPRRISQHPLPVRMNLWLFEGRPPTDRAPVEIVVRAFRFTPEQ